MSGYAGELFVKILPDASNFDAALSAQLKPGTSADPLSQKYAGQLKDLETSFRQAGKTLDTALFGSTQAKAQALTTNLKELAGQGRILSGIGDEFAGAAAAEAQAAGAMNEYTDSVRKAAVAEEQLTQKTKTRGQAQAQTFRSQLRNVASGRASAGSLVSPQALLGFGVGGLAVGAIFQGLQHVQEALRVTGAEAATTEGRFRNLGASLASGDVVGGILALSKGAELSSTALRRMGQDADTATGRLRLTEDAAKAAAAGFGDVAAQINSIIFTGQVNAIAENINKAAQGTADALTSAARVVDKAEQAARNKAEAKAAARRLKDENAPRSILDQISNAKRTATLQDDIAGARAEEAYFRDRIKGVKEGTARYTTLNENITQAITRRQGLEEQVQSQASAAASARDAAAKSAAAAAQAQRDKRNRERAAEIAAAKQEYLDDISFQEELLDLNLRRAGLETEGITKEVAAEKKLISFYKKQSENKRLSKEERRKYFLEYKNEQIDLAQLQAGQNPGSAGGGSSTDIFAEAISNFNQFASNVSPLSGGFTAGQVRGSVAAGILQQQLSEAGTTNALLKGILVAVTGQNPTGGNTLVGDKSVGAMTAAEAARLGHHLVGT